MADDNKVTIELDLEAEAFKSKLKNSEDGLGSLGEHGARSFHGIGSSALELNAILELSIKAFEIVKEVFRETIVESIHAAMEEEQSIVSLNLAISNSNYASVEASESMHNLAESMSKTSIFSKDMIMSLEAQAVNLTKNEDAAKKMTQAAIELSAATGKDVHTAMQTLSLSMEGVTRGLDKIIPGMKNLSESQLRAGAAADLVMAKFGGSALTITETFSGRVSMLKKSFQELHESIGNSIVQSPIMNRAIEGMTILLDKATHAIEGWVKSGGMESILEGLMSISTGIVSFIIKPLEVAYNVGKYFFDAFTLGVQTIVTEVVQIAQVLIMTFLPPIEVIARGWAELVGLFSNDLGNKFKKTVADINGFIISQTNLIADATGSRMSEMVDNLNNDAKNIFSVSFSDQLTKRLTEMKTFFEGAKKPNDGLRTDLKGLIEDTINVSKAFSKMHSGMKTQAEDVKKNAGKMFEDLGKQIFNSIGSHAANAFSAFGKALVTGKNAMQAFADSLLNTLGTMAVQIGSQMILTGAAYSWAGMPNGPPLIAAGAALAAFGGIMSGVGGGSSGGASSGGGITGGAASAPAAAPTQSATPSAAKSQAQIVIQGDWLNSRETGNHLAEILRQNSDITDYTITAQGKQYA